MTVGGPPGPSLCLQTCESVAVELAVAVTPSHESRPFIWISADGQRATAGLIPPARRRARPIHERASSMHKIAHHRRVARLQKIDREIAGLDEPCLIGWHSLVVRTTGMVAPCCILQASPLGNIFKQSLREMWFGEEYARFRRELSRIIHERAAWSHDAAEDKTVVPMCGGKSAEVCPIKSFYYRTDVPFMKAS